MRCVTGSPADVDPSHFGAKRHPAAADADASARKRPLLRHADTRQPVLAIIAGKMLSLNVLLGGSLIQDIPTELGTKICHSPEEDELPGGGDSTGCHARRKRCRTRFSLGRATEAEVNSWHHQSVLEPGQGLVTARAPDGVVEAVEWTDNSNWVVGVQWHPKRMRNPLAQPLFRDLWPTPG